MSSSGGSEEEYVPSKESLNESSSDNSDDLTHQVPTRKVKRKKSQRTGDRKKSREASQSTTSGKDSEVSERTYLQNVSVMKIQKRKDGARV